MRRPDLTIRLCVIFLSITHVLGWRGGYISLINATPYDWHINSTSSSGMEWKFPQLISSGSSHEQHFEYSWLYPKNSGSTVYTLANSPRPMSFTVKFTRPDKRIEIQYNEELRSLNNARGTLINLGYIRDGSVLFSLAGNGTDALPFVSSNPPVAWMQATFDTIGSKSLREFTIPSSHDSGMSEVSGLFGGMRHNTVTQTLDTFSQLYFGARHFDIRPISFGSSFWTGHFSKTRSGAVGCTGRSLNNIIDDVNRFTAKYPGELIILDLSHDMNARRRFLPFRNEEWQDLYQALNEIDDLWMPSAGTFPVDLSTVPLSNFIAPGSRSAVLIRHPNEAPAPKSLLPHLHHDISILKGEGDRESGDSESEGVCECADETPQANRTNAKPTPLALESFAFLPAHRLPHTGSWSDTTSPSFLSRDQLSKLKDLRPSSAAEPHVSVWTLSQSWHEVTNVGNRRKSIVNMAIKAKRAMFRELWPFVTGTGLWPTLIEVDDIRDSGAASLSMAINEWFWGMGRSDTWNSSTCEHPVVEETSAGFQMKSVKNGNISMSGKE